MDLRGITEIVGKVIRKKLDHVEDHLSLEYLGVTKSIGLATLRSLVQSKTGMALPPISVNTTLAQLVQYSSGLSSTQTASNEPSVRRGASVAPSSAVVELKQRAATFRDSDQLHSVLGIGLDLQEIDALPNVNDFRADPFYTSHFTAAELSTAVLRADPRAHLCGIFCLKEAVKKSHPALLDSDMTSLLVLHDESGRPTLRLADGTLGENYTFAVSITHSGRYAAATCLTMVRAL